MRHRLLIAGTGHRPGLALLGAGMILAIVGMQPAIAQMQEPARDAMAELKLECLNCHTCEKPTAKEMCLRPCARVTREDIETQFMRKHGPELVILDELEDRYLPVPFDHKGHAAMASMTKGCATCHHFTPEGLAHPACKTCHEVNPRESDIRMPSLKGAYHRQCMSCHRDWSGDTRCGICHHPKTGVARRTGAEVIPTKGDIIGRMHPPIPEPDVEIYTTERADFPLTKVMFRHKEHIHRYGLACAECHHEDNCQRCHSQGREHTQRVRTLDEHHQPCSACHAETGADMPENACAKCHYEKGQTPPPPFDHATTGWPLNRYHEDLSCRACHADVPFTRKGKEVRDCVACHDAWSPANFDHKVTGQVLDETHEAFDCEMCHLDRNYGAVPSCEECHDEDEGIAFPARRPGPLTKPK